MKLATISHSHIALRQQFFFKEVARQGHEVLMISPGEWGNAKTQPQEDNNWRLVTCRHIDQDIYTFQLPGAKDYIMDFQPDWLIVQQEPESILAQEALGWAREAGSRYCLFSWQNIAFHGATEPILNADIVICGNPEAEALVKPLNKNTALLLQCGIDTDHFQYRPSVDREIRVGFVGRPVPEKGLTLLSLAWPTAQVCQWVPYLQLPWIYSQIEVLAAYSQDKLPYWAEQAPPYVAIEALSTQCKVVVSDTAASKHWLDGCPAVVHVPQGKITELKEAIERALDIQEEGRSWVVKRFSNPVVARKLLEALENA